MPQPDIIDISHEVSKQEMVSLKSEKKLRRIQPEVEKVELGENIKKFDRLVKPKPRVFTENPYSYNSVSLKKRVSVPPTQTAEQMITNPHYNAIGKALGVDTTHEWNRYYDRVYEVVEWAKNKSGQKDTYKLIKWISSQINKIPSLSERRIDNLYLFAHMQLKKR